jgi:hypothetical protein
MKDDGKMNILFQTNSLGEDQGGVKLFLKFEMNWRTASCLNCLEIENKEECENSLKKNGEGKVFL